MCACVRVRVCVCVCVLRQKPYVCCVCPSSHFSTFTSAVVGGRKNGDSLWTFEQLQEDMK